MAKSVGSAPRRGAAGAQGAAEDAARAAARASGPWLQRGARLGYAASGVVYLTLGLITLQGARGGGGGGATSSRGAIATLAEQPFGKALVLLMGIGLLGYAAWRLIEAATGAEGEGDDAKGMAVRAGHAGSGLLYGALGAWALRLLAGRESAATAGDGGQAADWTARLMGLPAGRALVAAAGLGVAGYGLYQLYRAVAKDLTKRLDLGGVSADARRWIVRVGRAGMGARGVVFAIVGGFLLLAALRRDPGEAGGLGEALAAVERAPYGAVLLSLVALGLMAYGVYQLVNARWRRVATA
jgi:hypothetical protein